MCGGGDQGHISRLGVGVLQGLQGLAGLWVGAALLGKCVGATNSPVRSGGGWRRNNSTLGFPSPGAVLQTCTGSCTG